MALSAPLAFPKIDAAEFGMVASVEEAIRAIGRFDLPRGSALTAGIDAQFASSQYLSPDFIESGHDDGYVAVGSVNTPAPSMRLDA